VASRAASRTGARIAPTAPAARRRRLDGVRGSLSDRAVPEVDRLIYERVRLGILSALAVTARLSFSELRRLLETTDGNLSVHARKLEEAGYVSCAKSFNGRVPKTEYQLTAKGRRALARYLDHMEALIHATRNR
jgi:DNA-binding HxlR family transcriptional regulator